MKNNAIEWFYSTIKCFVENYINLEEHDFNEEKVEEIISKIPQIIEGFHDPNTEEEYRTLAKKQNGTLATIQILDPATHYKVYKSISTDEYKNFYYECLMYSLVCYEMFFCNWKYEIIDESNNAKNGEFEITEASLPHLLGIEAKYIGNCDLLNKIIGDYNGKSPIEQILLIIKNYEKIKKYEEENGIEIFNYYKSMQKVKDFLLLGRFFNEYRTAMPEQYKLWIFDKDDSTNQMWLYKKSNMNSTMKKSIIKILIQLNEDGKYFPRSMQSITEDLDAIYSARCDLGSGIRVWSDLPIEVRRTLLAENLIQEGECFTPQQRIVLKENESMINPYIFQYQSYAASHFPKNKFDEFITFVNESLPSENKIIFADSSPKKSAIRH